MFNAASQLDLQLHADSIGCKDTAGLHDAQPHARIQDRHQGDS